MKICSDLTMPKELRDAHKKLDELVLKIYGFSKKRLIRGLGWRCWKITEWSAK